MAFTIQDSHDLVQLLVERPEWRSELRSLLLSEELRALPGIVRELAEAQHRTEERLTDLVEAQRRSAEHLGGGERRLARLENRVG